MRFFQIEVGEKYFCVVTDGFTTVYPVGRFACKACGRQDVRTGSRLVATVLVGRRELEGSSADYLLAANTFRREHPLAGPLCGRCRFFRTVKVIGAAVWGLFLGFVDGTIEPGRQPTRK